VSQNGFWTGDRKTNFGILRIWTCDRKMDFGFLRIWTCDRKMNFGFLQIVDLRSQNSGGG
jgi:hypothetical protein